MKYRYNLFVLIILSFYSLQAQNIEQMYQISYSKIDSMLMEQMSINFKNAVFDTENTFLDGQFEYNEINNQIKKLVKIANFLLSNNEQLIYSMQDKDVVIKNAALFRVIADTIQFSVNNTPLIMRTPYTYDFSDPFGEKDWTNMFVSKLLETGKGNCHSLPYLYKILADELGVPAYLAFAPNHIYIKSYSEKTGWYNTELTSGTFPVDAWIMASGYVTVEAIQNGLYMDTLSNKQAVANCLVDLAQGYQRKLGKDNPDFVIKCCNTCLKYHPVNVNAMLTKAEAQKYYIQKQMEEKKLKKPQDLFSDVAIKEMYDDMEQTYVRLYQLGYRRMPEEMYLQWMEILRESPDKYNNNKITNSNKK